MIIDKLISLTGQNLIFPFYHSVSNVDVPFIKNLHPVRNVELFKADLDFLIQHYKPVSLSDVIAHSKGTKTISNPSFLLSFDDGLSSSFHTIAPILKKRKIPAVFFVNSAFVDNNSMSYRYKVSLLIDWCSRNNPEGLELYLQNYKINRQKLPEFLLSLTFHQRHIIDAIAMVAGLNFVDYLQNEKPYLDSLQLKSLIDDGFSIGAHSSSHPLYSLLELYEQQEQTRESLNYLKSGGISNPAFAFPFTDDGVSNDFFKWLQNNVSVSFGTAGLKKQEFPFHFQRIPMEKSLKSAKEIITAQYLRWLLKAPLGMNKIKRS